MISNTSLLSYFEILEDLGKRQVLVLKAIKELGECNNRMISEYLGLPINCVTGRVNELHKRGVIINSKTDICPIVFQEEGKNRLTKFWRMRRRI